MKKFSMDEIRRLQYDEEYLQDISESMCLVEFDEIHINERNFIVHINFVIIEIIVALKNNVIDKSTANHLLNKVDALYYSVDMLPMAKIIEKLDIEIIQDVLGVPYFDKIAIMCCDLDAVY